MKRTLFRIYTFGLALLAISIAPLCCQADQLALWTFENLAAGFSATGTTPGQTFTANSGSGTASALHASASSAWSSPVGNGTARSLSSDHWASGDYYQFSTSSIGFNSIQLSWDQTGSNSGPGDFKLAYSTNGTTFTDVPSGSYTVLANASPNPVWTAGTAQTGYSESFDLSSIAALNNAATILFRLIDTSTRSTNGGVVGTAGSDRVDTFLISATAAPAATPEPTTIVSAGCILMAGGVVFLRRKMRSGRS